MRVHKYFGVFIGAGVILLLIVGMFFLLPPTPVSAQCGSQASSCKNCHETQAQDPVNNDGTAWHSEHAFGDFCYLCHAGNNQAADITAAHTGLEAPLANIDASCKNCHPDDTTAKAQLYATTLGLEIGAGSGPAATPAGGQPVSAATAAPVAAQASVVLTADMVDYSQRYDEVVLGKKPVNVGNIILLAMLGVLALGGGFFVLQREGIVKLSFEDPKKLAVEKKYPADLVELLPELSRLKPEARKALRNILAKPAVAADIFGSIDKLTQKEPVEVEEDQPEEDETSEQEE